MNAGFELGDSCSPLTSAKWTPFCSSWFSLVGVDDADDHRDGPRAAGWESKIVMPANALRRNMSSSCDYGEKLEPAFVPDITCGPHALRSAKLMRKHLRVNEEPEKGAPDRPTMSIRVSVSLQAGEFGGARSQRSAAPNNGWSAFAGTEADFTAFRLDRTGTVARREKCLPVRLGKRKKFVPFVLCPFGYDGTHACRETFGYMKLG